jgi:hypothetical protein
LFSIVGLNHSFAISLSLIQFGKPFWQSTINQRSPDQGGSRGASILRHDAGELSAGADCGRQQVEGATASDDPWLEALVPGGECQN